MPNIVNRMLIQDMTRSFAQAEGMVVCSFGGLDIPETENLRTKLAEQGVEMRMVRNRLARRVLADQGLDPSQPPFWLPGQNPTSDNHLPFWWSK